MSVCITGGSGFIGRRLVEVLSKEGYCVKVLTRRTDCVYPDGVEVVLGDLTSSDCPLGKFLGDCETIFHCSGEIQNIATMRLLHVEGTRRLLRAALNVSRQSRQRIHWVQLSSVGAYGPALNGLTTDRIVTEETPSRPAGEYEITKTMADELVMQASTDETMQYSIVRPSNVFGPQMSNQSLRALIQMVKRGLFFYIGKPGAVATYVHVDDVVAALMKCAFEPAAKGRIYNLSNDCLLEDLVEYMAVLLGVRAPRLRIPETLIRTIVDVLPGWVDIPLNRSRIDALVNRTRYPADRIVSELGFSFLKPMPASIDELV